MTADIELLPLPGMMLTWIQSHAADTEDATHMAQLVNANTRANVAHATAAKDAEIEALRESLDWTVKQNDRLLDEGRALTERVDRLAEALEHVKAKLEDVAVIRGGHGTFAGTYLIVTEALRDHDQEDKNDGQG